MLKKKRKQLQIQHNLNSTLLNLCQKWDKNLKLIYQVSKIGLLFNAVSPYTQISKMY